jgi:hypothetical protein
LLRFKAKHQSLPLGESRKRHVHKQFSQSPLSLFWFGNLIFPSKEIAPIYKCIGKSGKNYLLAELKRIVRGVLIIA